MTQHATDCPLYAVHWLQAEGQAPIGAIYILTVRRSIRLNISLMVLRGRSPRPMSSNSRSDGLPAQIRSKSNRSMNCSVVSEPVESGGRGARSQRR